MNPAVSTSEAARLLGISKSTLIRAVNRGTIQPAFRTPGRHLRFTAEALEEVRQRLERSGGQRGFTLVELLVVIAILGIMAAIILFNISGVNANAACKGMKTDGATIQGAADLYWNTYGVYPVGNAGVVPPATLPGAADAQTPAAGTTV